MRATIAITREAYGALEAACLVKFGRKYGHFCREASTAIQERAQLLISQKESR